MNLGPLEDALYQWVLASTGLPAGQIFFSHQPFKQPQSAPFITISVSTSIVALGAADEMIRTTNLANPAGTEVTQTVYGIRDMLVTLQAFAENRVHSAPGTGLPGSNGMTDVDLLSAAQIGLSLDSIRGALNAANLAPHDIGQVRRISSADLTYFEGRAVLDVKFYTSDTAFDQTGYIAEVTGTGTINGTGGGTDPETVNYQAGP